jgi:fucose permease
MMNTTSTHSSRFHDFYSFITTSHFLFFLTLFGSFLMMGVQIAIIGPSLLELGEQTGSDLSALVYIFSGRSIGFFLGTIIGGDLVDRFQLYGTTILTMALTSAMLLTALIPLIPLVGFLVFICLIQGIALGIVDNVAQVLLIRIMEDGTKQNKVQPYMQALHAAFGVGGFCAPLILSPFLGGDPLEAGNGETESSTNGSGRPASAVGSTTYHYAYYLVCLMTLPVCLALAYYMRSEVNWSNVLHWIRQKWAQLRGQSGGAWGRVEDMDAAAAAGSTTLRNAHGHHSAAEEAGYADEQHDGKMNHEHSDTDAPHSPSHHGQSNSHHAIEMVPPTYVNNIAVDSVLRDSDDESSINSPSRHSRSNADPVVFRPPPTDIKIERGATNGVVSSPPSARSAQLHSLLNGLLIVAPPAMLGAALPLRDSINPSSVSNNPNDGNVSPVSPEGDVSPLSPTTGSSLRSDATPSNISAVDPNRVDWKKWRMVGLLSIFLFLYVGCESGYSAYIFTYSVDMVAFNAQHAAYLTAVFWFAFAVGRLLGIPISLRFSATTMIFSDLLGAILSVLALILFHDSAIVLWIGTLTYGLSVASIYPSAINYAESHFQVSGRVLSVLVVSASLGEAIVPLLMGLSFTTPAVGPLGLMFITSGVAVGAAVIFAGIVGFVAPRQHTSNNQMDAAAAAAASAERRKRRRAKRRALEHAAIFGGSNNASEVPAAASSSSSISASSSNPHHDVSHEGGHIHSVDVDSEQKHDSSYDQSNEQYSSIQLHNAFDSAGEEVTEQQQEHQHTFAEVDIGTPIMKSNEGDITSIHPSPLRFPSSPQLNNTKISAANSPRSPTTHTSSSVSSYDEVSLRSPIKAAISRTQFQQQHEHTLPEL